jgi:IS5 family transposase
MLTLVGGQVECLWDEVLPIEVRELPDDLARLDRVLSDSLLLFPIAQAWEEGARERGRPSISMEMFVRLMVIKQRTGWGYETLVRQVSDSLHLRRFCLIAIDQRVPDESTVRKLARRRGSTRRWSRPTSATHPMRCSPWTESGRSRARAASCRS